MSNSLKSLLDLEFHSAAKTALLQRADEFATSLMLEAKNIAYRNRADIVISSYIDDALEIINSKKKDNLSKQVAQVIGGAFFGAFIQGFITELSTGNTLLIVIYVVLGFLGVGLFTWGLRR
jgi:hypothetical protein